MIILSILAGASVLLTGSLGFLYRQNRYLKRELDKQGQELTFREYAQDELNKQIKTDTGCESVRELLGMYSGVLRTLPSSLGRFYQSREYHSGYQYIPGPEIQRQVAVVGRVLRGMQEARSRFRPVMDTVVIDRLMFADELKQEFPDLLPLLEGLTFKQMVGLALTVIDFGGVDIPDALRRAGLDKERVKLARQHLANTKASESAE